MSDRIVPLVPTAEMLEAGRAELVEQVPDCDLTEDEISDLVCFVWQAMYGASK